MSAAVARALPIQPWHVRSVCLVRRGRGGGWDYRSGGVGPVGLVLVCRHRWGTVAPAAIAWPPPRGGGGATLLLWSGRVRPLARPRSPRGGAVALLVRPRRGRRLCKCLCGGRCLFRLHLRGCFRQERAPFVLTLVRFVQRCLHRGFLLHCLLRFKSFSFFPLLAPYVCPQLLRYAAAGK